MKATAFLIADDRGESDYKNCSAVNLSGKTAGCSEVKAALNLVDNATTPLPRLVTLKGTLVKNTWGLPGLKEVTTAILEDGTIIGEGEMSLRLRLAELHSLKNHLLQIKVHLLLKIRHVLLK